MSGESGGMQKPKRFRAARKSMEEEEGFRPYKPPQPSPGMKLSWWHHSFQFKELLPLYFCDMNASTFAFGLVKQRCYLYISIFFILMNRCFEYAWEKEEACEEKWITSVCVVERSIQVRQTMCVNSTFFLCFRGERERCTEVEKRSAKKFLAMARRRKRSPFESVRNKIWEYQCFYIKEIVKCFFFMKSIPIQILNITIWCFCIITFS